MKMYYASGEGSDVMAQHDSRSRRSHGCGVRRPELPEEKWEARGADNCPGSGGNSSFASAPPFPSCLSFSHYQFSCFQSYFLQNLLFHSHGSGTRPPPLSHMLKVLHIVYTDWNVLSPSWAMLPLSSQQR